MSNTEYTEVINLNGHFTNCEELGARPGYEYSLPASQGNIQIVHLKTYIMLSSGQVIPLETSFTYISAGPMSVEQALFALFNPEECYYTGYAGKDALEAAQLSCHKFLGALQWKVHGRRISAQPDIDDLYENGLDFKTTAPNLNGKLPKPTLISTGDPGWLEACVVVAGV